MAMALAMAMAMALAMAMAMAMANFSILECVDLSFFDLSAHSNPLNFTIIS